MGKGKIVGDHDPIPGRATESRPKPLTSILDSQTKLRLIPTTSYSIGQFSIDASSDLTRFEKSLLDHLEKKTASPSDSTKYGKDAQKVGKGGERGEERGERGKRGKRGQEDSEDADDADANGAVEEDDEEDDHDHDGPLEGSQSNRAQIMERRLMVAVHNGARFVTDPEYHSLHHTQGKKGKGHDMLSFKGTVVLPEVPVHPAYALVLLLEYRVKIPMVSGENKKTSNLAKTPSTSNTLRQLNDAVEFREELVAVRWIPIIPAAFGAGASSGPVRVEVPMLGGPVSTPEGSLIYAALAGDVNARFSLLSSGGSAGTSAAAALAAKYSQHNRAPYSSFWDGDAVLTMTGKESVEAAPPRSPLTTALPVHTADPGSPVATNGAAAEGMRAVHVDDSPDTATHGAIDQVPLPIYGTIGDLTGVVSRAVQAKLYTARFPNLIHEDELPGATEVETMQTMPGAGYLDLHKEATDDRQGNKVSFQFLAYTHLAQGHATTAAAAAGEQLTPASLFFTFRFNRFPSFRSRNMRLGHGEEAGVSMVDGETQVLYDDGQSGFSVCYSTVSMLSAGVSTATAFAKYLGARSLVIEIWDCETLLLVGTAGLDLAQLLRGGVRAIQAVVQLPVHKATVTREVGRPMADSTGVAGYGGEPSEALAPPQVGTLIMRIANVGQVCSGVTPSDGSVIEGIASNAVSIRMDTNARKGEDQSLKSTGKLMSDRNPDLAQSIRAIKGAVRDESRKLSRFDTIRNASPRRGASGFDPSSTLQSSGPGDSLRDTSVNWLLTTHGQGMQSTDDALLARNNTMLETTDSSFPRPKKQQLGKSGPRRLEKVGGSFQTTSLSTQSIRIALLTIVGRLYLGLG